MNTITQINIENRQSYFFYDMKSINDFDLSLLIIDEVSFKNDELVIYDINYINSLNT